MMNSSEISKRDPAEVADILAELKRSMRRWPEAGIVAGIVNIGTDTCDTLIGTVDFSGTHCAALADAALERAIERMSAMPDPPLDLISRCHQARVILDFDGRPPNG